MDEPTTTQVLHAIEQVRDEAREQNKRTDARFIAVESKLADVASLGEQNAKHIGAFNDSLLRVASGAAKAVDLALEAKQQANKATDEASKIVESALRIHGASIAASVDDVVKKAVLPLSEQIDTLKQNDVKQSTTLANQDTQIAIVVRAVTGVTGHWSFKLGIAIGAGIAGYLAH